MNAQLEAIVQDLRAANARLQRLVRAIDAEAWHRRPSPESWSPSECVAHLNLTSEAFLPLLRTGLDEARRRGAAPRRYSKGAVGWVIWRLVTPSGRFKVKTSAPFVPSASQPPSVIADEFGRLQADVIALVRQSDGLPIDRVSIASPFDARAKYNLYAAMAIIPRHQHRHLLQAERAAGAAPARA